MEQTPGMAALVAEAEVSVKLAERHCRRGDHAQAAFRFEEAAKAYADAGKWEMAGRCVGNAQGERRWVRVSAAVNVSALVD